MNQKGIAFTLESLLGLSLCILLLAMASFYLLHSNSYDLAQLNLYQFTADSLAVLDKQGALSQAVEHNSSTLLQSFLNSWPSQYCGNLSLQDQSNSSLMQVSRNCTFSNGKVVARRVFISREKIYYATLYSWWNHG